MSLFQALCLLLFNDAHEFSLQDIQDATKIGLLLCLYIPQGHEGAGHLVD